MVSLIKFLLSFYRFLSGRGLSFLFPKKTLIFLQNKLTNQYVNEDKIVDIDIGEMKYLFYPRPNDELLLRGVYERGTTKIIKELSKNFKVFVDVGACYGYFTLISNSERKIAIEPDPENYQLLKTNISNNNIEADLVEKAVSEKNGHSILYSSKKRKCHSLIQEHILDEITDQIEVETITLDNLLQNYEDKSMLFKIDVEGHEPYVFKGMKNLLEKEEIAIIFEFSPHKNNQKEKQIVFETAKNFLIYLINDEKGSLELINHENLKKIENRTNMLLTRKKIEI